MTAADWSFACPDWQERLRDGRSLVPDLPIDDIEGERAVNVFNRLRLPDVPGQPPMSEAAGDWFRDIVRVAFDEALANHKTVPTDQYQEIRVIFG